MGRRLTRRLAWLLSCGNFSFQAARNGSRAGCLSFIPSMAKLREVCYLVEGSVRLPEMTNGLHVSVV
jgi:hypothetical protein